MFKKISQKLFRDRPSCEHERSQKNAAAFYLTTDSPELEATEDRLDKAHVENLLQNMLGIYRVSLDPLDPLDALGGPSNPGTDRANQSVIEWTTLTGKHRRYAISPEMEQCTAALRRAQESPEVQMLDDLPEMALSGTFRVHPAGQGTNYHLYPPKRLKALLQIYVPGHLMDCGRKE